MHARQDEQQVEDSDEGNHSFVRLEQVAAHRLQLHAVGQHGGVDEYRNHDGQDDHAKLSGDGLDGLLHVGYTVFHARCERY